jgi:hypothetical protein
MVVAQIEFRYVSSLAMLLINAEGPLFTVGFLI